MAEEPGRPAWGVGWGSPIPTDPVATVVRHRDAVTISVWPGLTGYGCGQGQGLLTQGTSQTRSLLWSQNTEPRQRRLSPWAPGPEDNQAWHQYEQRRIQDTEGTAGRAQRPQDTEVASPEPSRASVPGTREGTVPTLCDIRDTVAMWLQGAGKGGPSH